MWKVTASPDRRRAAGRASARSAAAKAKLSGRARVGEGEAAGAAQGAALAPPPAPPPPPLPPRSARVTTRPPYASGRPHPRSSRSTTPATGSAPTSKLDGGAVPGGSALTRRAIGLLALPPAGPMAKATGVPGRGKGWGGDRPPPPRRPGGGGGGGAETAASPLPTSPAGVPSHASLASPASPAAGRAGRTSVWWKKICSSKEGELRVRWGRQGERETGGVKMLGGGKKGARPLCSPPPSSPSPLLSLSVSPLPSASSLDEAKPVPGHRDHAHALGAHGQAGQGRRRRARAVVVVVVARGRGAV